MIVRIATAAIVLLWSAAAAEAQPSFDCAKASTAVERAICDDARLAQADREMATVYGTLWNRLSGTARDHLSQDQLRWLANRAKACTGGAEDVARCARQRYVARIATLKAESEGPYPFVSEQALVRSGKVGTTRYEIDASYPQFDGPNVDFSAVNRAFAAAAEKGAQDAVPPKDAGYHGINQVWTYLQSFQLFRPSPHSISVATTFYIFTGGAHGSSGVTATLVDLRTGHRVPPAGVFAAGSDWKRIITDIARADLKRQFVERPGFAEALEPTAFDKLMADPDRYLFKADSLEIIFNQYDVAAYVMGRYTVEIPYSRLSSLIRNDGPLGR
ncbi:DUF3298 domain-containing protein [Reyranella sp.]|uniref:DUF3298 domain-containing protein n=1 Tax=Reyranella sp. TaxID=1929291 RepID=UPI003D0C88E8